MAPPRKWYWKSRVQLRRSTVLWATFGWARPQQPRSIATTLAWTAAPGLRATKFRSPLTSNSNALNNAARISMTTPRNLKPSRVVNIADLRKIAERRVPRAVFDYLDGGAEGEVTLRENCRAFEGITFRPRHAVAVKECDLRTKVLGNEISFPV